MTMKEQIILLCNVKEAPDSPGDFPQRPMRRKTDREFSILQTMCLNGKQKLVVIAAAARNRLVLMLTSVLISPWTILP